MSPAPRNGPVISAKIRGEHRANLVDVREQCRSCGAAPRRVFELTQQLTDRDLDRRTVVCGELGPPIAQPAGCARGTCPAASTSRSPPPPQNSPRPCPPTPSHPN